MTISLHASAIEITTDDAAEMAALDAGSHATLIDKGVGLYGLTATYRLSF